MTEWGVTVNQPPTLPLRGASACDRRRPPPKLSASRSDSKKISSYARRHKVPRPRMSIEFFFTKRILDHCSAMDNGRAKAVLVDKSTNNFVVTRRTHDEVFQTVARLLLGNSRCPYFFYPPRWRKPP